MEFQQFGCTAPRSLMPASLHFDAAEPLDCICVGEEIQAATETTLRGHGTQVVDDALVATVSGVVEKVNRLVTVRTLRSRYSAEVGDVVVGRVVELGSKRWLVDLHARQEAQLLLSAVTLPGGVQRRRTAEDELSMREVFQEGDLISAEVQALQHEGAVMLHTRSSKYGRLAGGQVVRAPADLIKRQKLHFQQLPAAGVDIILGCNGLVWVAPHAASRPAAEAEQPAPTPTAEQREAVARAAQAVAALAQLGFMVHGAAIADACTLAVEHGVAVRHMLGAPFLERLIAFEQLRGEDAMQS